MEGNWEFIYFRGYVSLMQNKSKEVVHISILLRREFGHFYIKFSKKKKKSMIQKKLRISDLTVSWQSKWDPKWLSEVTRSRKYIPDLPMTNKYSELLEMARLTHQRDKTFNTPYYTIIKFLKKHVYNSHSLGE